jgi:hypothetical protein
VCGRLSLPLARLVALLPGAGLARLAALLLVALLLLPAPSTAGMSRHRNVGGWVADTYDDDDDDEGAADGMEEIPVNSYVMARFYGDDSFCPGTVIGWSQYGYLVSFEGYEDEIAQDTDPRDVELVRLPDENEACDGIDMDTFNDLVAEIASVMEGEAGESDIRAALETSSFSKLSQMARQRQVPPRIGLCTFPCVARCEQILQPIWVVPKHRAPRPPSRSASEHSASMIAC